MNGTLRQRPGSWRGAWPELAIAAVTLGAGVIAAYAVGGPGATVLVVVIFSVIALIVIGRLLPTSPGAGAKPQMVADRKTSTTTFLTYWRSVSQLVNGSASAPAYQVGLRPQLEHLLAARLSEHHGVNLYNEPELAIKVLCASRRDADLWPWVDPARRAGIPADGPGIPVRVLARLVRRLEQI